MSAVVRALNLKSTTLTMLF